MQNKYGYRVDITKPKYRKLYDRYKKWRGIPAWCPLSDAERLEFEQYVERGEQREKNSNTV
jgi:hypothetical protein